MSDTCIDCGDHPGGTGVCIVARDDGANDGGEVFDLYEHLHVHPDSEAGRDGCRPACVDSAPTLDGARALRRSRQGTAA
jgi:hypothetical protein